MLSIMVFVPYINLDFETFNCYYIINSNYSEPSLAHSQNRTMLVLSRCFAANFAHMCGGGSIRATLKTRKPAAYMQA